MAFIFLIKEHCGLTDKDLKKILQKCEIESLDILSEANNTWFTTTDKQYDTMCLDYKNLSDGSTNLTSCQFSRN